MKLPGMRFSKDAVLGFLLDHVEKIVVTVIGLLALLLAWNGVSALRLKSVATDRRPDALVRLTNETMQHIDAEPNPPADTMRRSGELAKVIDPWRTSQVKVAAPPAMAPLSRPTVAAFTLRGEPQVFPVEDLRAFTGVAVVMEPMNERAALPPAEDPASKQASLEAGHANTEEPRKRYEKLEPCVVLVGLIPVAKQRDEFRRVLAAHAEDPALAQQAEVPRWGGFVVERAQVKDGKTEQWLKIRARIGAEQGGGNPLPEPFLLRPDELARADGAAGYLAGLPPRADKQPWSLDTIHPWFLQPRHKWRLERDKQILETPVRLGPKEFREQFADHVGHAIEIVGLRFAGPRERTGSPDVFYMNVAAVEGPEKFPPPNPALVDATPTGATPATSREPVFVMTSDWLKTFDEKEWEKFNLRVVPMVDGGAAVAQIVGITPLDAEGMPGVEQRDPRTNPAGGFGPGGEGAMPPPMMAGGGPDEGAEYRLFRFVDNTVEFGLTYRYRVRLELANPNWGLDPTLLVNPKSAENDFLTADSDSSAPVPVATRYVMVVRDVIDDGTSPTTAADEASTDNKQEAGRKPLQLGRTQVEISFLGPTWKHKRTPPLKGEDDYDFVIEHVAPVEPGSTVFWRRKTEKTRSDSQAAKAAKKPGAAEKWTLIPDADVERQLIDFRGRQTVERGSAGGPKEARVVREPVEFALLGPDGSLEVVTAASSQDVFEAFSEDDQMSSRGPMEPGPTSGDPLLRGSSPR